MIATKAPAGAPTGMFGPWRPLAVLLGVALLSGGSLSASAVVGLARACPDRTPSFPLSHAAIHLPVPVPAALTVPLGGDCPADVAKGYDPGREEPLVQALQEAGLEERLLRVGTAEGPSGAATFVKLQAGDTRTGTMGLGLLHRDLLRICRAVFAAEPATASLDVWAVIPERRALTAEEQLPVFSVSVRAQQWREIEMTAPEQQLPRFGLVRYDPGFLQLCPETLTVAGLKADMPGVAFADPPRRNSAAELSRLGGTWLQAHPFALDGRVAALWSGDHARPAVCLTIDDGPHPLVTPLMLDILRQHGAKATFFLVGSQVEHYPELAARIADEGHELGNHTYSHQRLTEVEGRWVWAEIMAAEQAIARITGVRTRFFRPPGGQCTAETLRIADSMGYVTTLWTHNTGDWQQVTPEAIAAAAVERARPGAVILIHQDNLASCRALSRILDRYQALGFRFVTASQALTGPPPRRLPQELIAHINAGNP